MLRFNAQEFAKLCFYLEQLQGDCLLDEEASDYAEQLQRWRDDVKARLHFLKRECARIGLASSVAQCDRIASLAQSVQIEPLCYLLRDLRGTITQELSRPLFLKVRDDLAPFYDEMDNADVWGTDVGRAFPHSVAHVGEARRCLALERWEASAHHLMLAAERAIRAWATRLRVRTRGPLELEDLQQIIHAAEAKLKELKQRPTTYAREKSYAFCQRDRRTPWVHQERVASPSAHGRASFDERKVRNLMTHVEAFARLLAFARTRAE